MYPLYFGPSQRSLFGVYHQADGRPVRKSGVVLCHPIGHEYIRSHRAFRNLAVHLSQAGHHVFRFDYYGTGDSSGESGETRLTQCHADIDMAIEELKDTSGVATVSLVGLRMGGAFAALAAERRRDIDTVVLWDPVANGARHLTNQLELQERWYQTRPWATGRPDGADAPELIGFPLPDALAQEMRALTLATVQRLRARRLVVLLSEGDDDASWQHWAQQLSSTAQLHRVDDPGHWDVAELVHHSLLPHAMLKTIVSLLS